MAQYRLKSRVIFGLGILFFAILPWQAFGTPSTSLNLQWLDKSVNPTTNFYAYANGGWQKAHPIPDSYSRWNNFYILHEQNQQSLRDIIEAAAKKPTQPHSNTQKIVDFYLSGMDEASIEQAGSHALDPLQTRIQAITNLTELQQVVAFLQQRGVNVLFNFGQMQDFKDSQQVIAVASQGGLGLPDRDYYLKNDAKLQAARKAYAKYLETLWQLNGASNKNAFKNARKVIAIETMLAKASMSRIDQRSPEAIYHPHTLAQLNTLTPRFAWAQYFSQQGHPEIQSLNVAMPGYFRFLDSQLKQISINDWKVYLQSHVLMTFAPYLSANFVNAHFQMHQALTGAKALLPRWERVLQTEDQVLGFALGQLYVEKKFPPTSKTQVEALLKNIRTVLQSDLQTLYWMSPSTRQAALQKLAKMDAQIGYPNKWRDYSALTIDKNSYVQNLMRANVFLNQYELNKIGKPVDRDEWNLTPQTVNAEYGPSMNRLTIPAGILQPPFFDPKAPAAMNYARIGSVMGHEITHGFDDEGAQFNSEGKLQQWWTDADIKKFHQATQCVTNQFSRYTIDGNFHLQGKLVVGEATADLGGLLLAYRAFLASEAFKQAKTIAGFSPQQQFFLNAANVWASNIRPEEERRLLIIDPRPPAQYRVNGTFANLPEFKQLFAASDLSPMVNQPQCMIW